MISEYLNINLIEELGLDKLPANTRESLLQQMTEVLESRLMSQFLMLLPENEKQELDKVLDTDGDLVDFLQNKIPNLNIVIAETLAAFKKEMLDMQAVLADYAHKS